MLVSFVGIVEELALSRLTLPGFPAQHRIIIDHNAKGSVLISVVISRLSPSSAFTRLRWKMKLYIGTGWKWRCYIVWGGNMLINLVRIQFPISSTHLIAILCPASLDPH